MTFWGVEVKPNKPFTVDCDEFEGKLILTQATLGVGSSTKKSTLQCNIGDKSPVFLCTLLPEKTESCPLNLEFDEEDNVKFSVIGPTSIHLAGFVQEIPQDSDDDADVYGEDISGTESEESDYDSEESSDHDFIDDCGMPMCRPSNAPNSGVVIEEIVDDEKDLCDAKNDQKAVVKDNKGTSVLESEDEDGFPVSQKSKPNSENGDTKTKDAKHKKNKKKNVANDHDEDDKSLKRKIDAVVHNEEPKSDTATDKKKKEKKKQKVKNDDGEANADIKKMVSESKTTPTTDTKQSKPKQSKVRTYSNGMIVEELRMGKPDGKRASKGRKVSVHYVGKLQKNGKQFDSNVGRAPFKFRLGVGQVIKGWDVGVEGMRVGDKRRLTIPPSMGYGSSGAPPQIPPNAWLVFDVELVDAA